MDSVSTQPAETPPQKGAADSDALLGYCDVSELPPIDAERDISLCPPHAETRGIFLAEIARRLRNAGAKTPRKRYVGFRRYTQREFMELAVDAAQQLFPDEPLREGLRLLGQGLLGRRWGWRWGSRSLLRDSDWRRRRKNDSSCCGYCLGSGRFVSYTHGYTLVQIT